MKHDPIAAISRVLQRIEEVLLSGGILLIAALTVLNVVTRTTLGFSLAYAEELSQFAIIVVTFVGLSYGASKGRHIRMTALYDQLGPRARKGVMLVISSTTSLLLFVLAAWSMSYIGTMQVLGTLSPALQVPFWVVYLAAPLGLVLAGLQYALAFVRNLRENDVYLSWDHKDEYDDVAIEPGI